MSLPTLSYSQVSSTQTIVDPTSEVCNWPELKRTAMVRWRISPMDMLDGTMWLLNQLDWKLKHNSNFYIAITSREFGSGKTETGLGFCRMFDKQFSLENCLAYDEKNLARIADERKRDFTVTWDEPQRRAHSTKWQDLPESLRDYFTSQRANGVNLIFATPKIDRLTFTFEDNLTYLIHIRYRCKFHVHAYLYEASGNPIGEDWAITHTLTFPKPTDPFLVSELERYRCTYKQEDVDARREDFVTDQLHGGRTRIDALEFARWYRHKDIRTKKDNLLKPPSRIYVNVWASQTERVFPDSKMDEIYGFAKIWFETGEIEEVLKEVKQK